MSALPPKADIVRRGGNVCFVPKADIARRDKRHLFDHCVGNGKDARWDCQAKRLGRLEIDDQLEFGRLKHRKIGRFLALEDAAGIESQRVIGLMPLLRQDR
jgi:hypothetical protein